MNPLESLLTEDERPVRRAAPAEAKNDESLNLLSQMMQGVSRKR